MQVNLIMKFKTVLAKEPKHILCLTVLFCVFFYYLLVDTRMKEYVSST